MVLETGDLVACYVTNTSEYESLMSWGVVLDTNELVGDILVFDDNGHTRWWNAKRWRILSKKSQNLIDFSSQK